MQSTTRKKKSPNFIACDTSTDWSTVMADHHSQEREREGHERDHEGEERGEIIDNERERERERETEFKKKNYFWTFVSISFY